MQLDLRAAKAYIGGIFATSATQIADFVIRAGMSIAGLNTDPPPSEFQQAAVHIIAGILGFLAVYWTNNQEQHK